MKKSIAIDWCESGLQICFERGMAGGAFVACGHATWFLSWCGEYAVMVEVCQSQHLMCFGEVKGMFGQAGVRTFEK